MNRVAIIGSGLIGTSLGLALRRSPDRFEVTAWDASQSALAVCQARGGCNRSASSLRDAVRDADVVVLAAPLDAILVLMQELTTHLNPSTLVTDVAGVKVPPVETARLLQELSGPVFMLIIGAAFRPDGPGSFDLFIAA